MPKFMKDRCSMICGEFGGECITANNKQVRCVTDMVVNQAYGIQSIVEMIKDEDDPDTVAGYMEEIATISTELINWAKYLQVSSDIRNLMKQLETGPDSTRRELRYPIPEEFTEFIYLRVEGPIDPVNANIINFSQSGIQFMYDGPPPPDCVLACTLMSHERIGKKVSLLCEVKYFAEKDGKMLIGAQVVEVTDSPDFNFFMNVLELISEASALRQTAA